MDPMRALIPSKTNGCLIPLEWRGQWQLQQCEKTLKRWKDKSLLRWLRFSWSCLYTVVSRITYPSVNFFTTPWEPWPEWRSIWFDDGPPGLPWWWWSIAKKKNNYSRIGSIKQLADSSPLNICMGSSMVFFLGLPSKLWMTVLFKAMATAGGIPSAPRPSKPPSPGEDHHV